MRRKDVGMYTLSEDGGKPSYVYRGPSYIPPAAPVGLLRVKASLLAASIALCVLVFLQGRLDFATLRVLYGVLPFLLSLFGAGWCALAAASLFSWKERMTQREHRKSWAALGSASLLCALGATATLIGAIVFILYGGGGASREWPLLALLAAQAGTAVCIYLYMRRNPCRVEPSAQTPTAQGQERIS